MSHSTYLPFALPDIGEREIAEVVAALRSGWITTGPRTQQFEGEFASFLRGSDPREIEAIAVNSATAGLHLALEAIGIGPGDEVITSTNTFTATAEVVRYLGADPVFVDIDASTLNLDPAKLEAAVTPKTKALLPVHFGGLPCDMTAILAVARRHGLRVIEDAAHALPSISGGRLVGTLESDATVFSFYATKTLTTGEGGMVVTRDPAIASRCRVMRTHGIDRDAFDRYNSPRPSWEYEVVAPGFKYNLTDVASAIGIHQLRRLHEMHGRRVLLADRYREAFHALPLRLPADPGAGETHAWHLFVIRLADESPLGRDAFIQTMADRGIGCSVHFIPLHRHPYWRDRYRLRREQFPVADDAFQRSISLPLYSKMTDDDAARVTREVRSLLGA